MDYIQFRVIILFQLLYGLFKVSFEFLELQLIRLQYELRMQNQRLLLYQILDLTDFGLWTLDSGLSDSSFDSANYGSMPKYKYKIYNMYIYAYIWNLNGTKGGGMRRISRKCIQFVGDWRLLFTGRWHWYSVRNKNASTLFSIYICCDFDWRSRFFIVGSDRIGLDWTGSACMAGGSVKHHLLSWCHLDVIIYKRSIFFGMFRCAVLCVLYLVLVVFLVFLVFMVFLVLVYAQSAVSQLVIRSQHISRYMPQVIGIGIGLGICLGLCRVYIQFEFYSCTQLNLITLNLSVHFELIVIYLNI